MCNSHAGINYFEKLNAQERGSLTHNDTKLYHYTPLTGLQGILSTKKIWLNPYHNLSDNSEIEHSKDIFLSVIKKYISHENYISLQKEFEQLFFQVRYVSAFTSFCESPILENMWTEYADNKNGAIIHFNIKLATESASNMKFVYFKVKYGDKPCRTFFENMINELDCIGLKNRNVLCKKCYTESISAALSVLPAFKREQFSGENEHRISYIGILFPSNGDRATEGNNYDFKPYALPPNSLVFPPFIGNMSYRITLPFKFNAISAIILRNNQKMNELKRNIRMLFYNGLEDYYEDYYEDIDRIEILNYNDL